MIKVIGFIAFALSNMGLAASIPVLTCTGQSDRDTYNVKVDLIVTQATAGGSDVPYLAKVTKNGKVVASSAAYAFDNGEYEDYGYESDRDGLKISITHIQLQDLAFPFVRGELQLSGEGKDIPIMCNTHPAKTFVGESAPSSRVSSLAETTAQNGGFIPPVKCGLIPGIAPIPDRYIPCRRITPLPVR